MFSLSWIKNHIIVICHTEPGVRPKKNQNIFEFCPNLEIELLKVVKYIWEAMENKKRYIK